MNQHVTVSPPALMKVGGIFSLIAGSIMVLSAVLVSFGQGDTSGLRDTPFGEWALPFWGISTLLTGIVLVVIGWAIRARRPWVRPVVVLFWVLLGLQSLVALLLAARNRQSWEFDLMWFVCLLFSLWYFYRKRSVVTYFATLSGQREA